MHAICGNPTYVVGNYLQYVENIADNISASVVYDNYFGTVVNSFAASQHQNVLSIGSPDNGQNYQFIYNNVFTGTTFSGGVVKLWLDQFATVPVVGYAFNNVIYDNSPGNLINQGHGLANTDYSTWNFFNNTVECGMDSDLGACISDAGAVATSHAVFNSLNNYWVSGSSPAVSCTYYTCSETTDLLQSLSTANGQGYTSGEAFAFSPTSAAAASVGAGTNEQSLCTTIAGLNAAAGIACQSDTSYGCGYNQTNHTVSCPARTAIARPTTGAWDVGAYEYTSGGGTPTPGTPTVPTGLSVTGTTTSTVSLSWSASSEQGGTGSISGYDIYRNGSEVGSSANTAYTNVGLTASTTYSYTIAAYDNNGNTSAQSGSVNATTQAGSSDTTPPTISISSPANNATVSSTITISGTASDNVSVASVAISIDGGTYQSAQGTTSSDLFLEHRKPHEWISHDHCQSY